MTIYVAAEKHGDGLRIRGMVNAENSMDATIEAHRLYGEQVSCMTMKAWSVWLRRGGALGMDTKARAIGACE